MTIDDYEFVASPAPSTIRRKLMETAELIVGKLNRDGYCVLDNFLGEKIGMKVFSDVLQIARSGKMKDGELVVIWQTIIKARLSSWR